MTKPNAIKFMVGLFTLALFYSPALADLDELELYDDFNAKSFNGCKKCIDTTKWSGRESESDYIGEVLREIKGKRAVFAIRSWGDASGNIGKQTGQNILILKDDPSSITGVCFTPRIKKVELNACEANERPSMARMRYKGPYYSSDADSVTLVGTVVAEFWFSHTTENEKNEFEAYAAAFQCAREDCGEIDWGTGNTGGGEIPDLHFGLFKKSNKTEFCVGYDSDAHELVFSAGDDVRYVGEAHNLPPQKGLADLNLSSHSIRARLDIENCESGMLSGYLEGDVDNILVRRSSPPAP